MADTARSVLQLVRGMDTQDGAGVKLKRIIGSPQLNQLDPFLLLDEFKNDNPADYIAGFPPHPHRGFETVTYMLAGNFTHRDSRGNEGHLRAGSVQWMTAGRGLIHSEMPAQEGGLVWGFQLWVNLPAKFKMIDPRYQDIGPEKIPVVESQDARVKVIAGEYGGKKGPCETHIPTIYLDVALEADATFSWDLAASMNCVIYVFEGAVAVTGIAQKSTIEAGSLGVLGGGSSITLQGGSRGARLLLLAAEPIREPISRAGPFVMNTRAELAQAFEDYESGKMGPV